MAVTQQGNPDARDPETAGGEAAKPVQGPTGPLEADASRTSRPAGPANTPIPEPRNDTDDGVFTSWNGAAGGPAPAEPEIKALNK